MVDRGELTVSRHEILGPGNQAGIVIAAGSVPTTFTRSLSERTWIDQGRSEEHTSELQSH